VPPGIRCYSPIQTLDTAGSVRTGQKVPIGMCLLPGLSYQMLAETTDADTVAATAFFGG